jgi:hypothetical protein
MQKVDLPLWMPQQESFVLAVTPKPGPDPGGRPPGIEVSFAREPVDTLLVDFEGGELSYRRAGEGKPVREITATEVLLLSPEGKLLARDSATDAQDVERKERLEAWRSRIKQLKDRKLDPKNPFGDP